MLQRALAHARLEIRHGAVRSRTGGEIEIVGIGARQIIFDLSLHLRRIADCATQLFQASGYATGYAATIIGGTETGTGGLDRSHSGTAILRDTRHLLPLKRMLDTYGPWDRD
ncbi:hypothetical protein VH570_10735 [Sphingobium sp. HT1-2]|uniref:hypothetical protein n=1 Tax=Sphingobium sp. HT1-2 TaxID=3111640 RepID=UPI003C0B174F